MRRLVFLMLLCISTIVYCENITISDYQRTYLPVYTQDGDLSIAIRVFKKNNIPSFLLVDTRSLKTSVKPVSEVRLRKSKHKTQPGENTQWRIASTPYYQLLQRYSSKPYKMENYGITHARSNVKGNILTIDLCPSSAPFEKEFFDQLAALSDKKPTPVAISISGMWLLLHQKEFNYLLSLQQKNKLDITWVNHSFSHVYYNDVPYSKNFLISERTNEDSEILLTEQYLLEANQIPSVFFRFPGLVANKKLIMKINQFGLLPLGADGWIANNQPITAGGILLVHGNGNEHEGIIMLMPTLKDLVLVNLNNNV